jgi:hypothetical protein
MTRNKKKPGKPDRWKRHNEVDGRLSDICEAIEAGYDLLVSGECEQMEPALSVLHLAAAALRELQEEIHELFFGHRVFPAAQAGATPKGAAAQNV